MLSQENLVVSPSENHALLPIKDFNDVFCNKMKSFIYFGRYENSLILLDLIHCSQYFRGTLGLRRNTNHFLLYMMIGL